MLESAETRGKAVVVRDHHRRIQRLEVEDDDRMSVEHGTWLDVELDTFRWLHTRPLLYARRHGDKVHRLGEP